MGFPKMNEAEIEEMYRALPPESRGREADNPEWFRFFSEPEKHWTHTNAWPYAALCEDQEDKSLTWHIMCDAAPLVGWDKMSIYFMGNYISDERGRILKVIELIDRAGSEKFHLFAKDFSD